MEGIAVILIGILIAVITLIILFCTRSKIVTLILCVVGISVAQYVSTHIGTDTAIFYTPMIIGVGSFWLFFINIFRGNRKKEENAPKSYWVNKGKTYIVIGIILCLTGVGIPFGLLFIRQGAILIGNNS